MKTVFVYFCKLTVFPVFRLLTKTIIGMKNVPKGANFIVVSNHLSGLDHWFLANVLRDRFSALRYIAAMDNFKLLLQSGLVYYLADAIVINRKKVDRQDIIEKMIEAIKAHYIIVIYPEGNSNSKERLLKGKTGAAELALKTGLPVLPIGMRRAKYSLRRIIKIGEPLYFPEEEQASKILKDKQGEYFLLLRKVTDNIMREISELCGKPYPYSQ